MPNNTYILTDTHFLLFSLAENFSLISCKKLKRKNYYIKKFGFISFVTQRTVSILVFIDYNLYEQKRRWVHNTDNDCQHSMVHCVKAQINKIVLLLNNIMIIICYNLKTWWMQNNSKYSCPPSQQSLKMSRIILDCIRNHCNIFIPSRRERDVALWLECSLMVRWIVGLILHGVNPLSYFSFQQVLHDWCTKGCGKCYPACGMVHIKEPLLLIRKNSPCGGRGFPLSLSEWSFTICPTLYIHKIKCVECVIK